MSFITNETVTPAVRLTPSRMLNAAERRTENFRPEDLNDVNDKLDDVREHLREREANVKFYGAVCDGTTDDTAALQALLAALPTQSRTVVVPGPCRITAAVTIPSRLPVRFDGDGAFTGTGTVTYTQWLPRMPLSLIDTAAATGYMINMDHYARGSATAYALNILNRADNGAAPTPLVGAPAAIVIHQYSDGGPAMQIDNTRSRPFITFKNAENPVNSAGTQGTGPYLDFWGYTDVSPDANLRTCQFTKDLIFESYDTSRPVTFKSLTTAPSLKVVQTNVGNGILIDQEGASPGLAILQKGASQAINVTQTGAGTALSITAGTGAAGTWPVNVAGQNYGPKFSTSTNSGDTLTVQKDGTGAGVALSVVNKGTGNGLQVSNGTRTVATLDKDGMLQLGMGSTAALPTATAALRGQLRTVEGGAGVADKLYMCLKSAADAYSWVQVATG